METLIEIFISSFNDMSTAYLGGRRDIKLLLFPKIPDLVPTGQLAEGAAKNLLPPRGREGMPSSKRKGGMLPSREKGEGFYPPRKGGGGHHGTQNTISYVNGEQHLSSLSVPGWSQNNTNAMFLQEG